MSTDVTILGRELRVLHIFSNTNTKTKELCYSSINVEREKRKKIAFGVTRITLQKKKKKKRTIRQFNITKVKV